MNRLKFSRILKTKGILYLARSLFGLLATGLIICIGLFTLGKIASGVYKPVHLENSEIGKYLKDPSASTLVAAGIDPDLPTPPDPNTLGNSSSVFSPPIARRSLNPSVNADVTTHDFHNTTTAHEVSDKEWTRIMQDSKSSNSHLGLETWNAIPKMSGIHDRSGNNAFTIYDTDILAFGPEPDSPQYLLTYKDTPLINLEPIIHEIETLSFDGLDTLRVKFVNETSLSIASKNWHMAKSSDNVLLMTPSDTIGAGRAFFQVQKMNTDWTATSMTFSTTPATIDDFTDYEYVMDSGSSFQDFDGPYMEHILRKREYDDRPWKTKLVHFAFTNENAVGFSSPNVELGIKCSTCSFSGALSFSIRGGKHKGIDVKVSTSDVQATVLIEAYVAGHLLKGATRDINVLSIPSQTITIPNIGTVQFEVGNYIGYLIDDLAASGRLRFGARMTIPNSDRVIGHIEKNPFHNSLDASFDRPKLEVYRPMLAGNLDASGHVYHGVKMKFAVTPQYVPVSITADLDWKIPRFNLEAHTQISTKCDLCGPGKYAIKGRAFLDTVATASITPKFADVPISWLVFASNTATAVLDLTNFCVASGPSCKEDWKELAPPKKHDSMPKEGGIKKIVPNEWFRYIQTRRTVADLVPIPPPTPDDVDDFADLVWFSNGVGRSSHYGYDWGVISGETYDDEDED
ncbi:hypothetical protein BROUX41_001644 [Berkeleyomyces rouxiae]|uniref:uncharacterized protein n=1 Tax=Berkeleyomyces rouxiae TaxID=2035830 RepID=UPI003B7B25A3